LAVKELQSPTERFDYGVKLLLGRYSYGTSICKRAKSLSREKLQTTEKISKALGSKKSATNWAGFDATNTNKQAGMSPLNKAASMSDETAEKIMRKKGGRVHGADSLKRLDKAKRKGKAAGGARTGNIRRLEHSKRTMIRK
jgi:hypothetical protein